MQLFLTLTIVFYIFGSAQSRLASKSLDKKESVAAPPKLQIIGGVPAKPGQFPYLVALEIPFDADVSKLCSGTLISSSTVLTTAGCLTTIKANNATRIRVALNTMNITTNFTGGMIVPASGILVHPNYTRVTETTAYDNDIALIYLSSPVKNITTPKLPCKNAVFDGAVASIPGWGLTNGTDFSSASYEQLMTTNLTILSNANCSTLQPFINEYHMCAGAVGTDACFADNGGPLIVKGVVAGIYSYAWDYCNTFPKYASVFTRVSVYRSWIDANKK